MVKVIMEDKASSKKKKMPKLTKIAYIILAVGVTSFLLAVAGFGILDNHECYYSLRGEIPCPVYFDLLQVLSAILSQIGVLGIIASGIVGYASSLKNRKKLYNEQSAQISSENVNIKITKPRVGGKVLSLVLFLFGLIVAISSVGYAYQNDTAYYTLCSISVVLQILCIGNLFRTKIHHKDEFLLTLSVLFLVVGALTMIFYY